jgi:hypothetical protein
MFLHGSHSSGGVALASSSPERGCYVCGIDTGVNTIAEPLLVPVCSRAECQRRAGQLPSDHCVIKLADGSVCGAPLTPMSVGRHATCGWHARQMLELHD